ncbi:MAG: hypothetical protein C4296_06495 [Gemmataceae bacterium]
MSRRDAEAGRKAPAIALRQLADPQGSAVAEYAHWIGRRRAWRCQRYAPRPNGPRFSILTLLYNTPPERLAACAKSVAAQTYADWEWIVLDNGSTNGCAQYLVSLVGDDRRVSVIRSDVNKGITAGLYAALQKSAGDYVVVLDHDDTLYDDALAVLAWYIMEHPWVDLVYSDEDKSAQGRRFCPFIKPEYSPALLQSTGYVCHVVAWGRWLLQQCEVYSDPTVEGAQDWDVALRAHDAGARALRVPEVLYTWHCGPGSTAGTHGAKPYALQGQKRALERSLERRGLAGQVTVEPHPYFGAPDGHWLVRADAGWGEAYTLLVAPAAGADGRWLAEALQRAQTPWVAYWPPGVQACSPGWIEHGVTQLVVNRRAVVACGRLVDARGRLREGQLAFGLDQGLGTCDWDDDPCEIGYFGLSLSPRNVSAVWHAPWVAKRDPLLELIRRHPPRAWPLWLPELCLRLAQADREIVYAPHMTGWVQAAWRPPSVADADWQRLRQLAGAVFLRDPYYPAPLSLRQRYWLEPEDDWR